MEAKRSPQRLTFDILFEVAKYLEIPFYHRLRATCQTIHTSLPAIPQLEFESFKRHILFDFDKSRFKLRLARASFVYGVSPVVIFFLVKQKCVQEFMRCYQPDRYLAFHKQILLDYCADRCSFLKAEIALFILLGGQKGLDLLLSSQSSLKIVCCLDLISRESFFIDIESGSHTSLLNTESQLVLDNLSDWSSSVASFRLWFKNWYQFGEGAKLELQSFFIVKTKKLEKTMSSTLQQTDFPILNFQTQEILIESIILSRADFMNPLKADIMFAKSALVDRNTKKCHQIFSNPLIAALGERPSLFHIAMDSNHEPIINMFLEKSPRLCLAYYINKSVNGLDIPVLINSGRFDIEAADNLALDVACQKKFLPVVTLLLESHLVFLSKNWKASPIRILFDNGYIDTVMDILKLGIPNTGAEISVFRRSIQKGNLPMLRIFLQDKSGRFDPSSGDFKLLRLATKHADVLKELLSDHRCSKFSIIGLVPHFPSVSFDNRVTEVLTNFVMNSLTNETGCKVLKSINLTSLCKIACATGYFDLIQLILKDSWRSFPSKVLSQSLDAASFNGNLKVVKYLIEEIGVEPKPVHVLSACTTGNADVVGFILNGGYLKDLDMDMIQIGIFDSKVNRILYEFENKLWATSFQKVLKEKFNTPFKKMRIS